MSDPTIAVDMTQLFLRLRQCGYKLGVDEYQAALQALDAGYGADEQTFLAMVEILWGHSRSQQMQIGTEWEEMKKSQPKLPKPDVPKSTDSPAIDPVDDREFKEQIDSSEPEPNTQEIPLSPKSEVATFPIRAPSFNPIEREDILSLQSYFPLSRRATIYGWRFLRRIVADGCRDVVDVPATIQAVSDRGYYLAPVYRRRERNAAR